MDWLFRERRRDTFNPAGRHSLRVHDRDLTILWQPASDGLTALVAGPRFRKREWIDKLTATLDHRNVAIELVGPKRRGGHGRHSTTGRLNVAAFLSGNRPAVDNRRH